LYRSILFDKDSLARALQDRAEKTTTSINGMPSGGGEDRNELLASLADAKAKSAYWKILYDQKRISVESFLTEIPMQELGGIRRVILYQRYVKRKRWADIYLIVNQTKREAKERPISIRQMYYEHIRALQDCANWLNKPGIIKYRSEVLNP